MQFTFGTDPEFMICKHDEIKSAINFLPKKENATHHHGNAFYFDNVLAEIAVKPARNQAEALFNIRQALSGLAKVIDTGKYGVLNEAKFIIKASSQFPKQELNCMDAKIAGCNPEWNAYTLQCIFPPDSDVDLLDGYYQFKTAFRTAGGHIHVGTELLYDGVEALNMIKMMDLFLGIPSIFLDTDETSAARRRLYGHAGSHRITDYGIEYRVLGNFWLSSPDHVCLIYELTEFALNFVKNKLYEKFWEVDESLLDEEDPSLAYKCFGYDVDSLIKAINQCDRNLADKFMTFISNYLPHNLIVEIEKLSDKPLKDPYVAWDI